MPDVVGGVIGHQLFAFLDDVSRGILFSIPEKLNYDCFIANSNHLLKSYEQVFNV